MPSLKNLWVAPRARIVSDDGALALIEVMATLTLASAILPEASLSLLGVGVLEDIPSWCGMLSGNARKFMMVLRWMAVWPGLAITLAIMAVEPLWLCPARCVGPPIARELGGDYNWRPRATPDSWREGIWTTA